MARSNGARYLREERQGKVFIYREDLPDLSWTSWGYFPRPKRDPQGPLVPAGYNARTGRGYFWPGWRQERLATVRERHSWTEGQPLEHSGPKAGRQSPVRVNRLWAVDVSEPTRALTPDDEFAWAIETEAHCRKEGLLVPKVVGLVPDGVGRYCAVLEVAPSYANGEIQLLHRMRGRDHFALFATALTESVNPASPRLHL